MFSRSLIAIVLAGGVAVGAWGIQDEDSKPQNPQEKQDKIEVPSQGPEAVARRDFMRSKLRFSQMIFEGLTTGNLKLVREGAVEVREITRGSQWVSVDDDRYRQLNSEFETAIDRLIEAAESKNVDATALRYYHMSTSCIDCHKHIRKVGYEF